MVSGHFDQVYNKGLNVNEKMRGWKGMKDSFLELKDMTEGKTEKGCIGRGLFVYKTDQVNRISYLREHFIIKKCVQV